MKNFLRIAALLTIFSSLLAAAVSFESPVNSALAKDHADGNDNKRRGRGGDDQNRNGNSNGNSNRGNSNSNSNSGRSNSNSGSTEVSADRAREIALSHVPGDIVKEELKNRKGRRVFEFKIRRSDGALFEVKIDANDGSLVEIERK